jgi:hypothetical protein
MKAVFKLCIGIAIVWYLVISFRPTTNAPTDNEIRSAVVSGAPMEVVKTTAQGIFDAYESNEVATDNQLKRKIIEITGRVQSIDKSVWDTIYVSLVTNNEFMPDQNTSKL